VKMNQAPEFCAMKDNDCFTRSERERAILSWRQTKGFAPEEQKAQEELLQEPYLLKADGRVSISPRGYEIHVIRKRRDTAPTPRGPGNCRRRRVKNTWDVLEQ